MTCGPGITNDQAPIASFRCSAAQSSPVNKLLRYELKVQLHFLQSIALVVIKMVKNRIILGRKCSFRCRRYTTNVASYDLWTGNALLNRYCTVTDRFRTLNGAPKQHHLMNSAPSLTTSRLRATMKATRRALTKEVHRKASQPLLATNNESLPLRRSSTRTSRESITHKSCVQM